MDCSSILVEDLAGDGPHSEVIGYPKATDGERRARAAELASLGIKTISLTGPTILSGRTPVLGKGYAGVVVLAEDRDGTCRAVKIRRTDSQRKDMRQEAALLGRANSVGAGPKMVDASRNFLIMEYVRGDRIGTWIENLNGRGRTARLKHMIRCVLADCHRLDTSRIDHGELSKITKHIIVTEEERPVLIDFESASVDRRPSNVTSITQAIFISPPVARLVGRIYKKRPTTESVITGLRRYKQRMDGPSFEELLEVLDV